jgi:hypothetical protein
MHRKIIHRKLSHKRHRRRGKKFMGQSLGALNPTASKNPVFNVEDFLKSQQHSDITQPAGNLLS